MDLVINSLFIIVLVLFAAYLIALIRLAWLDAKAQKQLDDAVDLYLAATKLKYRSMLDELAKEDDGR